MKEPWIRVVKKAELGKRETLILRLEAIVLALVAGGFFILLIGQNPFVIYQTIVTGALRSEMAIQATVKIMENLRRTVPRRTGKTGINRVE